MWLPSRRVCSCFRDCNLQSVEDKDLLDGSHIAFDILKYYNCAFTTLLKRIDDCFSPSDPGSVPDDLKWGSWCRKWLWSRFFSDFYGCPLPVISPWHHIHLSLPPEVCDSPHQAELYHTSVLI
jgi:hypothetical protein